MEIGIAEFRETWVPYYRDLGLTWAKHCVDLDDPPGYDRSKRTLEAIRKAGLRAIMDVRVGQEYVADRTVARMVQLDEEGKVEPVPEGASREESLHIIVRNEQAAAQDLALTLAEAAGKFIAEAKDLCQDWEFWGEWDCPWVSQRCFGKQGRTYPVYLKAFYQAAHEADPDCRVWLGGNGMDLERYWLKHVLEEGGGSWFDVCNWHPYLLTVRDFDRAGEMLDDTYKWAWDSFAKGSQPFASTEFAYPVVRGEAPKDPDWLQSHVIRGGVPPLSEDEAADWYDRDLQIMDKWGFEVVCQTNLVDSPASRFWGDVCGLLTRDMEKKPTYEVIQKWAHRGREGRGAFA